MCCLVRKVFLCACTVSHRILCKLNEHEYTDDSIYFGLVNFSALQVTKYDRTLARSKTDMDVTQIRAMIDAAVQSALVTQAQETANREIILKQDFERQLQRLTASLKDSYLSVPQIKVYKDADILNGARCDELLDAVKCLPEFNGSQEAYVSWIQAAHALTRFSKDTMVAPVIIRQS